MERPGSAFGNSDHLRIADSKHPHGRSLWRLADGDRQQGDMRPRSGFRSTMSAYFVVQMVAARGAW